MKKLIKILPFILIGFVTASANNYCITPPFLTTNISPNVLFVIDKSGSMSWSAYNPDSDKEGWCNNRSGCGWTYTGSEEGYFIPDKVYKKNSQGIWVETNELPELCPHRSSDVEDDKAYLGSCLNFLLMSRMDLLRWAITGGRPDGCNGFDNINCDPDLSCSDDTCILETTNSNKVEVPKSRINGILQIFENENHRPRFGALFYGSTIYDDKIYIGDYPNGKDADPDHPYTYLKRAINYVDPGGGTGTAPAMWEAYDYFKQSNDHMVSYTYYEGQRQYTIIFDGFSIEEGTYKDPNYFCDYKGENCKPAPCAKNFVILASDGQWNMGGEKIYENTSNCSIEIGYENYSTDPVVPAYRMHRDILRSLSSSTGATFDISVNGVYALGLFLGGTGEQSLKNVAVYGSFDTSKYDWPFGTDGSHWDGGTDSHYPWDECDMDDCGNGKGSACTPLPPSSPDWDSNGDGEPDNFLSAQNATEIKNSLLAFIRNILGKTSAGTSVSVLSDKRTSGAVVSQAVFYPKKTFESQDNNYTVNWIGNLYTYWFFLTKDVQNIREDSNTNYYLDVVADKVLNFYIDTEDNLLKIDRCTPDDTGEITNQCETVSSLDDINYLWDAGSKLKETQPEDRNIYAIEIGDDYEFTIDNLDSFKDFVGNLENTCLEVKDNDGDYDHEKSVENLIKYIRGEDIEGCRIRKVDNEGNTWKLGDIIYSTPLSVNYDNYSVVYVGANDGMLHAFKLGKVKKINSTSQVAQLCQDSDNCTSYEELGKELWAFIPKNTLPYLRYLADTDYCHTYLVDLPPYLIEDNDKKILIGGLRLGGGCKEGIKPPTDTCSDPTNTSCVGLSSYFAIDITDPENPQFLWEFSHPDLGFSYSGPAYITRGNKKYVMFASGPQTYDGDIEEKFQELTLFILSLDEDFKITAVYRKNVQDQQNQNLQRTFSGRLFTRGIDVTVRDGLIINEPDGYTDLVFFGVNQINEGVKQGQLAVVVPKDDNPENWDIFANVLTVVSPGSGLVTKVEHMQCFNMNYIYFGTGRWFYKNDTPGTLPRETVEALYGIVIDDCLRNPTTDNCNFNTINNNDIGNTICDELSSNTSDNGNLRTGWRIELSGAADGYYKERVITDPTVTDQNVIFFTSMQPTSDICGFGGRTRVWALNCATGASVFDENGTCGGTYEVKFPKGKLLLQLSGGDVQQIGEKELNQSIHTGWYVGTPPNTAPPFISPRGFRGQLLLWLEK